MRPITSSRAENISIGELSKYSGVNIETIRYPAATPALLISFLLEKPTI